MKLTLEPRKTTWVPFLDSRAQLKIEWKSRAEYGTYNALSADNTWPAKTRYTFTGLAGEHPIPSAQLVLMERGIPLAISQTVVSAVKDKFQSEELDDPFLVIRDKLAGLKRSDRQEKQVTKGLIERTWKETIERSVRIENRTGRKVTLSLTVVDRPAESLSFVSAEPAPSLARAPEYTFELELMPDEERSLKIVLSCERVESIRSRVEKPKARAARPNAPAFAQELLGDSPDDLALEEEEPEDEGSENESP
jgi:hypothetical protein